MFSAFITALLGTIGAESLTEIFVSTMLVVCLSALVLHKAGRWRAFTRYAPTLLTSLGILGTFTGVVTGLLDFDSTIDNIDRSISLLLEGLKTAFISSLVGMGLSILYKVLVSLPLLAPPSTGHVAESAATIDDLYSLQRRQTADQAALLDVVKGQSERPLFDRFVELHRKLEDRAAARHAEQLDLHEETVAKILELLGSFERSCTTKLDGLMLTTERCATALADPESVDGLAWQLARLRSTTQVGEEARQKSFARREALLKELGESITAWQETANERGTESLLVARHALESNVRREKLITDLGETAVAWKQGSEGHAKVVSARLETFEDLLSQSAGEEIVKALEGVIREFNERLSEQFGKNFQELNAAVGRLLEWQDNYRDQLDDMRAQYDISVRALQDSERAMAAIGEESGKIPVHMDRLGEVISVNQHQIDELGRHLSAFADVHDSAVRAVPEIKAIVDRTVEELAGATASLAQGVESGAGSMRSAIERSVTEYQKATASVNVQAREIAQRTHEEVTASFDRLRGTLQKTFAESQSQITALISKEFQNMAETRRELSLDEMRTMSNALLKVTGRFTEDYSALVEAMGRVVDKRADGSR